MKKHPELLTQAGGRDIVQNFFVVNPNDTEYSFRQSFENLRQMDVDELMKTSVPEIKKIIEDEIKKIDKILSYFTNEKKPKRGKNATEMRKEIVKHAEFVKESLNLLIHGYEKHIENFPRRETQLRPLIDKTKHVLLDFEILLRISFPAGSAYLRSIKEELQKYTN